MRDVAPRQPTTDNELPMSEVLVVYDAPISGGDGRSWIAQACGRVARDGLWEGWLEFLPEASDASAIRTGRETEQSNRNDLLYWAQGLTRAYLEGALGRAIAPHSPIVSREDVRAQSVFGAPAERADRPIVDRLPSAVLNPYEVHLQGEHVLLGQLAALDVSRLRDIAVAYGFGDESRTADMGREALMSLIVAGARAGRSGPMREADFRQRP